MKSVSNSSSPKIAVERSREPRCAQQQAPSVSVKFAVQHLQQGNYAFVSNMQLLSKYLLHKYLRSNVGVDGIDTRALCGWCSVHWDLAARRQAWLYSRLVFLPRYVRVGIMS